MLRAFFIGAALIKIKNNSVVLQKSINNYAKQIPYALALSINNTAKHVRQVEKKNILQVMPSATPFTQNSIFIQFAKKSDPRAVVDIKDITAKYLQPFEEGGPHDLGTKKGLLTPIGQAVNQYGNIPAGKLAQLKGRHDVFIGEVKGVRGVWQRTTDTEKFSLISYAKTGKIKRERANTSGKLKLLIRFSDPKDVVQRLQWMALAAGSIRSRYPRELARAIRQAIGTSKR